MKKINKKSKIEKLFIIISLCISCLGLFCITGCGGGKSCEVVKCGSESLGNISVKGVSIPGCGGCITSGKGCNTWIWPQSCKLVYGDENKSSMDTNEKNIEESMKFIACDVRYFVKTGCGQIEKSCYTGFTSGKSDDIKFTGLFHGGSNKEEKFIGYYNGCGGCIATDKMIGDSLYTVEELLNIN